MKDYIFTWTLIIAACAIVIYGGITYVQPVKEIIETATSTLVQTPYGAKAVAANAYPNPNLTPGMADTSDYRTLTASYNGLTYSKNNRNTTATMKNQVCQEYPQNCKGVHEIDHLIPLALGGADDVKNLWAEPEHVIINGEDWGFHVKDKLESYLVDQMKAGKITPIDAQNCILKDWVSCYKKYLGGKFGAVINEWDNEDEVLTNQQK